MVDEVTGNGIPDSPSCKNISQEVPMDAGELSNNEQKLGMNGEADAEPTVTTMEKL